VLLSRSENTTPEQPKHGARRSDFIHWKIAKFCGNEIIVTTERTLRNSRITRENTGQSRLRN
jgi:hypothetical protein